MSYSDREENNFNLIRMIAAYLVILAHATAIQGRGTDIVVRITGQTHSGQMAVFIFTFLSGIFITKSILHSDSWTFLKNRFIRIYPELILCLVVILIIGGVFTTRSQFDYWTNAQTWKYFFANLLEISNEHFLPGVWEGHPNQGMNGVLWYITFEVRVYLVWILIKTLGLFDEKEKANIVLSILLVWVIARPETMPLLGSESSLYGLVDFPQYTITFILGALFYLNIKEVSLTRGHLFFIIIVMVIFRHSSVATWVWATGFIVIALLVGTNERILSIKVKDLSYGIFLYGWPTGQLVYEVMPNASAFMAAIVTALCATAFAMVSERVVYMVKNYIFKFRKKELSEVR